MAIAEGLLVWPHPDITPFLVNADQQGAALGVGEPSDRLGDHREGFLGDLAVAVSPSTGLEVDDLALLAGHQPFELQRPSLACTVEFLDLPSESLDGLGNAALAGGKGDGELFPVDLVQIEKRLLFARRPDDVLAGPARSVKQFGHPVHPVGDIGLLPQQRHFVRHVADDRHSLGCPDRRGSGISASTVESSRLTKSNPVAASRSANSMSFAAKKSSASEASSAAQRQAVLEALPQHDSESERMVLILTTAADEPGMLELRRGLPEKWQQLARLPLDPSRWAQRSPIRDNRIRG